MPRELVKRKRKIKNKNPEKGKGNKFRGFLSNKQKIRILFSLVFLRAAKHIENSNLETPQTTTKTHQIVQTAVEKRTKSFACIFFSFHNNQSEKCPTILKRLTRSPNFTMENKKKKKSEAINTKP